MAEGGSQIAMMRGKPHTTDSRSSPLQGAALNGHLDVVEFLVGKRADVHGHNGNTPLHVAAESGREEVTRVLVQAGARNIPNDTGYIRRPS